MAEHDGKTPPASPEDEIEDLDSDTHVSPEGDANVKGGAVLGTQHLTTQPGTQVSPVRSVVPCV